MFVFMFVSIYVCPLWLAKPQLSLRSNFQGLLTKGQGAKLT